MRAAGISWRDYDRFMQHYVKRAADERLTKVPPDLDLKPYRDEHDAALLQRMAAAVERGQVPPGRGRQQLAKAIGEIRASHEERRRKGHQASART